MHLQPLTHKQYVSLHQRTKAQDAKADSLEIPYRSRWISPFGNLKGMTDKEMFIIGRDGSILFRGKRK